MKLRQSASTNDNEFVDIATSFYYQKNDNSQKNGKVLNAYL